jgi:CheY-like chemotaxis protein
VPHTLLLADDSVTIQRVIELTFADEDVTVVAVSDGDQAIDRLEASAVDIVLADIGMPGKNGYEVAQYIRKTPKLAHIPVVLLTGAFEPVDQGRASEAGCDGVLAKPFEPQLVIGRVKELLGRSRSGDVVPDAVAPAAPAMDNIWTLPSVDQPSAAPFADPTIAAPASPAQSSELNDYFDRLDAAFSNLSTNTAPVPPPEPPPAAAPGLDWFTATAPETASVENVFDLIEPSAPPQPETAAPTVEVEPSVEIEERFVAIDAPAPIVEVAPSEEVVPTQEIAPIVEDAALAHFEEAAAIEPVAILTEPVEDVAPAASAAPLAPAEPVAAPARPAPAPALELPLPNPPPLPSLANAFAALLAAEHGEAMTPVTGLWPAAEPQTAVPEAAAPSEEVIEEVTRRVLSRLSDTVVRDAVADIASQVAERLVREEIERIKASIK